MTLRHDRWSGGAVEAGHGTQTMYDPSIMKRTQIYLDEVLAQELGRAAKARGVTSSHLIREAVARYLAGPDTDDSELAAQRAAITDAAGTVRRLPRGSAYVDELRAADADRERSLEARWRSS
jgi:Arc/MetJ family transcription regulator